LLLGAALRIPLLVRNVRLQPDEALYATFARHVAAGDWFLSGIALDKPPLLFWMMGGAFKLFGAAEFAARLPNLIVSVITLALVYALAKRLYDRRVALIAMLLLAVLPFDRAFAASAFTDPLLTLWVVASSLAAVCGRWRLSGICLALALFAKPSALQSIPLVLALGIAQSAGGAQYNRIIVRIIRRFAIGFGAGAALLIGWSAARAAIPDFWTLNAYNNTPGRLIRANEWLPRLTRWTAVFGTIAPLPSVGWLAVLPNLYAPHLDRPDPDRLQRGNIGGALADRVQHLRSLSAHARAVRVDFTRARVRLRVRYRTAAIQPTRLE